MAKQEWQKKTGGDFNPMANVKEKKGLETIGVYKGNKQVGEKGDESTVHTMEIDGVMTDFWGTGKLNYLLSDVAPGTLIKIVYLGTVKAEVKIKGKKVNKEVHDFELFTA